MLAIGHHVVERATPARLAGMKALDIGGADDLDALMEAQETFLQLLLAQQVEDLEHGTPPSNAVAVKRLSARDRDQLRGALAAVGHLDDARPRSLVPGIVAPRHMEFNDDALHRRGSGVVQIEQRGGVGLALHGNTDRCDACAAT